MNQLAPYIKHYFVAVAVNQLNGLGDDGEGGAFFTALGKRGANSFHVATAGGKLLGRFFLNGVNGEGYNEFHDALKKWRNLPRAERAPGPLKIKPVPPAPGSALTPPAGGLVLRVYFRNLKRDRRGELSRITKENLKDRKAYPDLEWVWGNAIVTEPMPDVLWLTEAEWKSLIPLSPKEGDHLPVPEPIRMRIFRHYLINGTFGLPHWWKLEHVRSGQITLTVERVTPSLRLRMDGQALLASDTDPAKASHGFDGRLQGILDYDPAKKAFTRFDVVAVGDSWGGNENGLYRTPGRTPLGIVFELPQGDSPLARIPPKGVNFKMHERTYFAAEKP